MKHLLLALFLLPALLFAQNKEGQVIYKETIKINIELPDDAPEEMKKMVPPSQEHLQTLLFNEREILYRDVNEDEQSGLDINHDDGEGSQIQIKMVRPQNRLYRDLENDKVIESRDFMGRSFLIKDEPQSFKWKLTGEKKKILDYECQKAILQDTVKKVFVWFTPQIPVSAGPATYSDLPGMILELDMDNGTRTYVATKVELKSLEKGVIEQPTKGKTCTRAEYDKIVAEKMKEMGAENGGGGGMKVIIRNN